MYGRALVKQAEGLRQLKENMLNPPLSWQPRTFIYDEIKEVFGLFAPAKPAFEKSYRANKSGELVKTQLMLDYEAQYAEYKRVRDAVLEHFRSLT